MNPLDDIVPVRYRRTTYAVIALLALAYSAWQANDGHWFQAVGGLLVTLSHATAASNAKAAERLPAPLRKHKGMLPNDPNRPRLRIPLKASRKLTSVGWYGEVRTWGMLLNDQISDCGPAGFAHALILWAAATGRAIKITDLIVRKFYTALTGYNPRTGANDTGVVLQQLLEYARKTGMAGHKIAAFGELALDSLTLHAAIETFGCVYAGIQCPKSAEDDFDEGIPWTVVKGSPDEGGHCVLIVGYDAVRKCWVIVTWGGLAYVTTAFMRKYLTEAWAMVTPDWIEANGDTPAGEAIAALSAEFTTLTGEPSPFPAAA